MLFSWNIRHLYSRFRTTDWRQLYRLWQGVSLLAYSRIEHVFRPIEQILIDLKSSPPRSPRTDIKRTDPNPNEIAWAVETAARYVPWRSDCLIQCMASIRWLRRRGHAPVFHLGILKSDQGKLNAHAWVTMHGNVLIGDEDEETGGLLQYITLDWTKAD